MDIKVGEYIRTPYNEIEKVIKITKENGWTCVTTNKDAYELQWLKNNKVKHSKNIIDLIEVEDIVNGYRILNIVNLENSDKKVFTICKSDFKDICRVWGEEDIRTILTHEQYNKNCFKVKGE